MSSVRSCNEGLGSIRHVTHASCRGRGSRSCMRMGKQVAVATCNHPRPNLQTGMFSRQAARYLRGVLSGIRLCDVLDTGPSSRR